MPTGGRCDVDEYLQGDDDLPVCMDSWETDFLDQLGQNTMKMRKKMKGKTKWT